jgi:ribosomal protein L21E
VQTLLQDRQLFSEMLQYQLLRAQNRMKQYADEKRSFREFAMGDKVFLKLQPYA